MNYPEQLAAINEANTEKPAECRLVRRCQWMCSQAGYDDCGAVATHATKDGVLAYCLEHAVMIAPYADVHPLAQPTSAP